MSDVVPAIRELIGLLRGHFRVEPSSAVAFAGFAKLGDLTSRSVVVINTGRGIAQNYFTTSLTGAGR